MAVWLHAFVVSRRTGDPVPSPHPASGVDRTIPVPTEQGSVAVQPEVTVPTGTAGEPLSPDLSSSPQDQDTRSAVLPVIGSESVLSCDVSIFSVASSSG